MTTQNRPRFTKAFLIRIAAVALFLCLGTFAVLHSIQSRQPADDPDQVAKNEGDDASEPSEGNETKQKTPPESPKKDPNVATASHSEGINGDATKPPGSSATGSSPFGMPTLSGNSQTGNSQTGNSGPPKPPTRPSQFLGSGGTNGGSSTQPPTAPPAGGLAGEPDASSSSSPFPGLRPTPTIPGDNESKRDGSSSTAGSGAGSSLSPTPGGGNASASSLLQPPDKIPGLPGRLGSDPTASSESSPQQPPTRNASGGFNPGPPQRSSAPSGPPAGLANDLRGDAGTNPRQPVSTAPPTSPSPGSGGSFAAGNPTSANPAGSRSGSGGFSSGESTSPASGSLQPVGSTSPTSGPGPLSPKTVNNPGLPTSGQDPTRSPRPIPGTPMQSTGQADPPTSGPGRFSQPGVPATPIEDTQTGTVATTPRSNPPATFASTTRAPGGSAGAAPANLLAAPRPGDERFEGVQVPALALQKVAPREVQVNREASFELVVKNTGRSAAENVQIYDYVPEGTRFLESVPTPSANEGGQLRWDLGRLDPGQQASIRMKLLPERPGSIGSVAHVTFGAQASAKTVCTQPELAITHEAPETILIGQDLILNITVANKGDGAAENVVLQEDVPEGLEFAGGQRELEYPIGILRPGESRNVQLRLRAAKVGQIRNVLVAHGEGKLQANDVVSVRIVAPQLTLTGEGPNRKFLNRPAKHTFTIGNQGTAPATNVQLVARLPRGLRFASANNQGQYDPNNHAVVWRLSQLDAERSGTVELTTMPVATGNQEIQVQAMADLNQSQQLARTLVVEQLSELFFDIDDLQDAIEVGSGTSYRIRVVNQGQIPASNVNIQVEFADAMRPEAVEGNLPNRIAGNQVILEPIQALAPGQEVSFVVQAKAMAAGEHRTVVSVRSDDREIAISKEESTHVYSDR